MQNNEQKSLHVAVGVVIDQQQQILIALRNSQQHQGNLWEFPGGKVEAGETVEQALSRELLEEVNIRVERCLHLLDIEHDYGDKKVILDVWQVDQFSGVAQGREGQEIRWVGVAELAELSFPEANESIISLIRENLSTLYSLKSSRLKSS